MARATELASMFQSIAVLHTIWQQPRLKHRAESMQFVARKGPSNLNIVSPQPAYKNKKTLI